MATKQPTPKSQSLATPPESTQTETPKPLGEKPSPDTTSSAATERSPIDSSPYGQSTLPGHEWLNGKALRYEPVSILFLTGDFASKVLDLGYNTKSLKESSSANWKEIDVRGVRGGVEFHNLSSTNIDFTVEFWSDNHNVRQLINNLSHLKQISGRDKTPPLLSLKIGNDTIDQVVCSRIDSEVSEPLPGAGGFRRGSANLSFVLVGGSNTKHALGAPLGATPLSDIARGESEAQKARQGEITRVNSLLSNCVSSEGISQIQELIESNKLDDPADVLALPNDALVSLAISGSISPETLSDPNIASKLATAIAQRLAESEPGSNPSQYSELATSLRSGIPSGISGDILSVGSDGTTQFERMVNDYNLIVEAVTSQNLGTDSPIFDRDSNPTAGTRLTNFGSCGLSLLGVGGISGVAQPPASESEATEVNGKLNNLNQFFQSSPSHTETLVRFGLPEDTPKEFTSCLVGGQPFSKQREFEDECQRCGGGSINGRSLWQAFQ